MQKRPSNHFFNFTRKEKNGTVFILFIILLLTVTPIIYSLVYEEKVTGAGEIKDEINTLKVKLAEKDKFVSRDLHPEFKKENRYPNDAFAADADKPVLFPFDPNTLSAAGWKKLGLKDKTIATIQNYLSKDGKFKQPGDIKKIWGLPEDQVSALLPYVKIVEQADARNAIFPKYEKTEYNRKTTSIIDLNIADSAALISLPGIGPGYAMRIIKFRERLGGFYDIDQVSETFGLPDSVFQKIKSQLMVSGEMIRKLNINTAVFEELKDHPYIRYQIANAILQYRSQHGNFKTVDDIKQVMLVSEELFQKLKPYLVVQ